MYRVLKRDGKIDDFKIDKIKDAITKAFKAEGKRTHVDVITTLALRTVAEFDSKIKDDLIEVEDIQDSVEKVLIESGFADVAKAFILYRKQRETIRNATISYKDIIDSYIDDNKNDNLYSIGGLVFSNSFTISSNYIINELFDQGIKDSFNNNYLYFHDLQLVAGHSLCLSASEIVEKIKPHDAYEFIYRLYAELRSLVKEWSGSITLVDLDKEIALYLKDQRLNEEQIDKLIYYLFDMISGPSSYKNQPLNLQIVVDPKAYEDLEKEINKVIISMFKTKASMSDCKWPTFTLINSDFEMSDEFKAAFLDLTNNGMSPIIEKRKEGLTEKVNYKLNYEKQYAGYGVDLHSGSLSLASLNLVRIAAESKNEDVFFELLDKYLSIAVRELLVKKKTSDLLFKENLYPFTAKYLNDLNNGYLTVGVTGLITMVKNACWIKGDFYTDDAKELIFKTLSYIEKYLLTEQKNNKVLFGLIPLINNRVTAYLVNKDKELKTKVKTDILNNTETYLSLDNYEDETYDIFDYLELYKEFDKYFKGNNIAQIKINKKDINPDALDTLLKKIELYDLKSFKITM